jgi:ATP-binding cassette subfamily B protein
LWNDAAVTRLFAYSRRYRARYAVGGLCLLGTATLAMAVPLLLKRAVDTIQAGGPSARISMFAAAIVLVALAQGIARTLSRALIFNVGRDIEYDLRNDLFAHLLKLPLGYYQGQQIGDLMSRMINDVTAIRLLLGVGILNLVNTPIYYVYAVTIMASINPLLTVMSLLPFPVLLLVVKRTSRHLMEQTLRVQEGLAGLSSAAQENISGIHVLKAHVAEAAAAARFEHLNGVFTEHSLELARVRGRLMPIMKLAAGSGTLMVLWYGGYLVMHGKLGLGDLVAFIGYLNILAWPTMAMGWMLSILQRGRAAMQRLEQIFVIEPEIRDRAQASTLPELEGRIEYRHASFAYPNAGNGHGALSDVSFAVEPGEKLAIVGRTGAGKTSIIQLVPRLFDVGSGAVLIDGHDVRDLPIAQLRGAIGYVGQDPFLFSATIRDNIAFGADEASEEDVRRAAEAAGIADDIDSFPRGYDTIVGERGITLSGGQKQRLTLARALLSAPRILVLDDALSSVDTRTERLILRRLREVMQGRTSIVVAHRISTILDADHIAVVDDGHIVELGTHDSLLAHGGIYADLFERQQLEEEIETL